LSFRFLPFCCLVEEELARATYVTMVKGVCDVRRGVIALGGEWHIDADTKLIADGSAQPDVWGFNVYPDEHGSAALEYISLVNIRPAQGNRSMEVEDAGVRDAIRDIVKKRIPELDI
jgi:hypothetical protein